MRLAAYVVVSLTACTIGKGVPGTGQREDPPEPVTVVEVAPVRSGAVSDLLVTSAAVESIRQADVVPQAAGVVREVRVDLGQAVQEEQLLAILDSPSLSEAATRARAELARLERDLQATRRLFEQGAVSRNDVEQLEHQVRTARSTLREARAGAGQTRLLAPFDGVVSAVDVRVGQLAPTGQRAFQVVDLTDLRVRANLPERDVGRVALGQRATLVSAYDESLTSEAEVARVAPVVDPQTGTFEVLLALPSDQRNLRPGQYVNVQLEVDRHEDVLTVPKEAVVYEDGAPVVYRMVERTEPPEDEAPDAEATGGGNGFGFSFGPGDDASGAEADDAAPASPWVAERVTVDVGLVDDTRAEIVDGLRLGDRVVVVGQSALKDGAPIQTPEMVQGRARADDTDVDGEPG